MRFSKWILCKWNPPSYLHLLQELFLSSNPEHIHIEALLSQPGAHACELPVCFGRAPLLNMGPLHLCNFSCDRLPPCMSFAGLICIFVLCSVFQPSGSYVPTMPRKAHRFIIVIFFLRVCMFRFNQECFFFLSPPSGNVWLLGFRVKRNAPLVE